MANKEEITNKYLVNANDSEKQLWQNFFKKKEFDLDLNLHVIKFVVHNKHNLEKIYKYINFRYFFNTVSKNKLFTDYPPYLLIEPVSTCNLRCPFVFKQIKLSQKNHLWE